MFGALSITFYPIQVWEVCLGCDNMFGELSIAFNPNTGKGNFEEMLWYSHLFIV